MSGRWTYFYSILCTCLFLVHHPENIWRVIGYQVATTFESLGGSAVSIGESRGSLQLMVHSTFIAVFRNSNWYKGCVVNQNILQTDTPPKTHMEPENGPLEKEIPFGNHPFQVNNVSFQGCISKSG